MFERLFNYPQGLWQQATLVFDTGWSASSLLLAISLALVFIVATLWRRELTVPRRSAIALLQAVTAIVALTMLWQPALQVSVAAKGENAVAWVLDTSRSMAVADAVGNADSTVRGAVSRRAAGLDVLERLAVGEDRDFTARLYALDASVSSVDNLDELRNRPQAPRTSIGGGLETLLGTLNDSALAAVVLVSDGADNSDRIDAGWWQSIAAAGVPVHTVGVGQSSHAGDLELASVDLPDTVQSDTQVPVRLTIRHAHGGKARVRVTSAGKLLAAEDISLPEGVHLSVHSLVLPTGDSGIRQLEFTVQAQVGEEGDPIVADPTPANNRQPRILQVLDVPRRILYVEGEPRWEYKFLRRAIDDYPGVEIVSLLRTSPNKFYRQGVQEASELANGFPDTREQLFKYDAVIIGSFEAAELSTSQQSALRDFVSQRGGSLLMLGGRQGLADGGWGRSVVAAALPVQLSSRLSADTFLRKRAQVLPTLAGLRTPWLQLADDDSANIAAWQGLPELADFQSVGQRKPGSLTLLEVQSADAGITRPVPLLVMQRYGRGQSLVLGTSGTWRWQMGLPSEDQRHELFWRQLLGMMVSQSVPRLAVEPGRSVYRDADHALISMLAYSADYLPLQAATLPVSLTSPDGRSQLISLSADIERAGRYVGELPLDDDGPYSITANTPLDGESPAVPLASVEHWWLAESDTAEDYGSVLQADFLQRISDSTGGTYLSLATVDRLSDVLASENAALKRESRLPLWNMPFFFLCLIFAKGIEWALRLRWKRL
ncbi:MAG: hypothetical protein HKN42_20010 [Granulosicoccus sp.]|nr:hypothetical protein [Granulosicoccus sp.]